MVAINFRISISEPGIQLANGTEEVEASVSVPPTGWEQLSLSLSSSSFMNFNVGCQTNKIALPPPTGMDYGTKLHYTNE